MGVAPGCLVRRRALGTEAVYRVVELSGGVATVTVVRAPGLDAGVRLRLARRDVEAMEPVEEPATDPTGPTSRSSELRRRDRANDLGGRPITDA